MLSLDGDLHRLSPSRVPINLSKFPLPDLVNDYCTSREAIFMYICVLIIELLVWTLLESFVNMDLASPSNLSADKSLQPFAPDQWSSPVDRPGDFAFRMLVI